MSFALPNFTTDLTGQVAIVTGASSGLGLRFAKVLARCGAKVALTARRVDRLEKIAAEINADGGTAAAFRLDVTSTEDLKNIVPVVEKELGPVSILINNAGIPDAQRATKMSVELIDAVLDTNVRAPWILSCEAARRMIELKIPGRIVNISSSAAFNYRGQGAALYSVSKGAVIRMTEALAVEWAQFGVNVNAIAPGAFASEMMDGMLERMGDITKGFPRQRLGQPEQMDSTLLFLCSPSSECVTGTYVRIDDGQAPR
ncbi:MAG: SDR family NAD(P)-dependent oxidoreductase [Pseudomonadota bacterium]|nr:SDR family NAD(P)-dependent oxidoreductase [Pseudomonadota bacterium]